jgi:murein endopeptidase
VAAAVYATTDQAGGASQPPPAEPPPADPPPAELVPPEPAPTPQFEAVRWRRSRALGLPWAGRLVRGVRLPGEGADFFTWDPVRRLSPNRAWRRWGTSRLIRVVLRILHDHRAAYSFAPRVGIGDISRPYGGNFGRRFGGLGHASHQNGLDVDIWYPRLDGLERRAGRVGLIDLKLAQDLVDRFVAAGAEYVFVGPRTRLTGPRRRVVPLVHHDDHMHVRVRPR